MVYTNSLMLYHRPLLAVGRYVRFIDHMGSVIIPSDSFIIQFLLNLPKLFFICFQETSDDLFAGNEAATDAQILWQNDFKGRIRVRLKVTFSHLYFRVQVLNFLISTALLFMLVANKMFSVSVVF